MKQLLFFLLVISNCSLSAQTEARMHQIIHSLSEQVNIEIDNDKAEVNIIETYANVLVIEVIVSVKNVEENKIEEWIKSGRYHVDTQEKNGTIYLSTKKENSPLIINEKEAEEEIIYNISIPEYMDWEIAPKR